MEDILLSLIDDNPFNARQEYEESQILSLAQSIEKNGLLSPVKVRRNLGRYQVVYGHRRVRASRLLGHKCVRAEVVTVSDEQMLDLSLVENLVRKDLSDYETAISFEKMSKFFHKSYEEIGKTVGYSKSHIANHLRMLQLFDAEMLEKNPYLQKDIKCISEHHARILLRIGDPTARASALRLVVSENLSVRELERTVLKLRSWFDARKKTGHNSSESGQGAADGSRISIMSNGNLQLSASDSKSHFDDIMQIQQSLCMIFTLPHKMNFEEFAQLHAFDYGFSIYSFFPPLERLEKRNAIEKEQEWFYGVATKMNANIQDLQIRFFNDVALVTLSVEYLSKDDPERSENLKTRGTVLFVRRTGSWKIVHEHWSPQENGKESDFVGHNH